MNKKITVDQALNVLLEELIKDLNTEEEKDLSEEKPKESVEESAVLYTDFGLAFSKLRNGKACRIARRAMPKGMYLELGSDKFSSYPYIVKNVIINGSNEKFVYSFPITDILSTDWYAI